MTTTIVRPRRLRARTRRGANVHHGRTVLVQPIEFGSLGQVRSEPDGDGLARVYLERFDMLTDFEAGGSLPGVLREALRRREVPGAAELVLGAAVALERFAARATGRHETPAFARIVPHDAAVGRVDLVWESESTGISRIVAEAAFAGTLELLAAHDDRIAVDPSSPTYDDLLAALRKRCRRMQWSPIVALLAAAASARGLPFEGLAGNYLRIGDGTHQHVLSDAVLDDASRGLAYEVDTPREESVRPDGASLHRLLVVEGETLAALRLEAPVIVGDGMRRLDELIAATDSDPLRRGSWRRIAVDEALVAALRGCGWRLSDVPPWGVEVELSGIDSLDRGAVPVDVTGSVPHVLARAAAERVARVGRRIESVDVWTARLDDATARTSDALRVSDEAPDPSLWATARGADAGRIGRALLATVHDEERASHAPVVLVLGSRGTRAIGRALDRFLRARGVGVGRSAGDRATILGRPVEATASGRSQGPDFVLRDPRVEMLVHVTSPRRVLARGLRTERADVMAWVGASTGEKPETTRRAIDVALRASRGPVVVAADAPEFEALARVVAPDRLIVVGDDVASDSRSVVRPATAGDLVELHVDGRVEARLPLGDVMPAGKDRNVTAMRRAMLTAGLAFALGYGRPDPEGE